MSDTQNPDMQAPEQPPVNPLLQKVRIPGETFTLPSRGIFYKNGELAEGTQNGEVHVLPMTTIDEIVMKTPDKLFSGEAINEVFQRCIPQVLKPSELLAKDVDYLLVCLRKLSYGPTIEIKWTHDCKDAKEHDYSVPLDPFLANSKSIDPTKVENDYTFDIAEYGQRVHLQPPRFKQVLQLYQAIGNEETSTESIRDSIIDSVVGVIRDVDGITDRTMIAEWLASVEVKHIHKMNERIEQLSDWGPTFDAPMKCKDCGKEVTISSPLNPIAFFM